MRLRVLRALRAVVRAPAAHFLVLGAALFAVTSVTSARSSVRRAPIVISSARVGEIRDEYTRTFRRVPNAVELRALVQQAAEEEMLYREALALGLDRNDRAIGWRILDKMHFLYGDSAGDAATAYKRGIALGLQNEDTVVRNALITKMKLIGKAASRADEPKDKALDRALEDYKDRHPDDYTQAEQISLTQVFLSGARRGAALDADADAARKQLETTHVSADDAAKLGDAFPAGQHLKHTTRAGLVKLFGEEFADAVVRLEPGRWSAPIRSPYGLHLVMVEERDGPSTMALEEVRERALRGYRAERHQQYLDKLMGELRNAYEVRVESDAFAQR